MQSPDELVAKASRRKLTGVVISVVTITVVTIQCQV